MELTASISPNEKKVDLGIFMLRDRQGSGFMKEGDDGSLFDELNSPRLFRIANPSKRLTLKEGRVVEEAIRYIKGCNTISVEEQQKRNIQPSPGDDDNIYFEYGKLIVPNEGETAMVFEFLTQNIAYQEAPNRPSDREYTYFRYYPEKVSHQQLVDNDMYLKAMSLVKDLYRLDNKDNAVYRKDKIDFLCNLFNVSTLDDYASKTATLMTLAKDNPKSFIKETEKVLDSIVNDVKTAELLGVIVIDKNKVILKSGNREIMSLESNEYPDRIDEIAYKLRTSNATDYSTIMMDIKDEQAKALDGGLPGPGATNGKPGK